MEPFTTEGQLVTGKYRVERVLGKGGMGYVVAAVHEDLGRRVALKFLHPVYASIPEATERFSREARAAAQIQNEHVVRILDVGKTEDGTPYIVMEHLEGEDLAELVARKGVLEPAEAVDYVLQACEALAEAHAAGIVHRDLKPSNVFLARRNDGTTFVKVLDFGIAKSPRGESTRLTTANAFVGTPAYSAPEQLTSASTVDARADVWAVGAILFELLCGRVPYPGASMLEIATQVLNAGPPDVLSARPDLPQGLAAVIEACLQRPLDQRVQNVAVLAERLAEFATNEGRASVDRVVRFQGAGTGTLVSALPPAGARAMGQPKSGDTTERLIERDHAERPIRRDTPGSLAAAVVRDKLPAAQAARTGSAGRARTRLLVAAAVAVLVGAGFAVLRSSTPPFKPGGSPATAAPPTPISAPPIAPPVPPFEPPPTVGSAPRVDFAPAPTVVVQTAPAPSTSAWRPLLRRRRDGSTAGGSLPTPTAEPVRDPLDLKLK